VKETKTGKVHVVALDPETVRLLEEHAKVEGEVVAVGRRCQVTGRPHDATDQGKWSHRSLPRWLM
jgi:type IV secretory pathway protease TraF